MQLACLDKDRAAPPASPAEGDRYLVTAAAPTGAWAGLSGQVVRFADGVWSGSVPRPGWFAYVVDEADLYVFDGRAWTSFRRALAAPASAPRFGINTDADPVNRLAVKSDAALLSWDDVTPGSGDMRIAVNKRAAARDAGLVFQTGYAARAMLGTLGGDDLVLKVSPDGASFFTALTAAAGTGVVGFPASPLAPTPASGDSSARLATTAFVAAAVAAGPSAGTATGVPAARKVAAGTGLTGGGDLSADRTLAVAAGGVTNALLAAVPAGTIKGNAGPSPGAPADLTPAQAKGVLGFAAAGANGDITALAGLTTALSIAQGGTGAATAAAALAGLGGAPLAAPAFTGAATFASGAAPFPTALWVQPSTHAASRRAALLVGDWLFAQDTNGDGTKDFGFYSNALGYSPLTIDASGGVAFAGSPTAPTPAAGDGSARLATTAYVDRAAAALVARKQVADAAYTIRAGDRTVAVVALSAPRTLTLPAASAYPPGATLLVLDESGACAAATAITLAAAGSDTVGAGAAAAITAPYGYLALTSNGANRWTVIDRAPGMAPALTVAQGAAGATTGFGVLEQLVTLSGASTTAPLPIPNRALVFAVSARVVAAVTGAPAFGVGVAGNATQFGGGLGPAAGATNSGVIGPTAFYAPTPLVVTASSGAFTGGAVRLALHYALFGPPTA